MAPLSGPDGLPDGPYLAGLRHLDLRGAGFTTLPQVRLLPLLALLLLHDLRCLQCLAAHCCWSELYAFAYP